MAKLNQQQQIAAMQAIGQRAAAWLVGLPRSTFRDSSAPRNADGTYDAAQLFTWQPSSRPPQAAESPSLERYRAARADLAEMERSERMQRLVAVDAVADWWTTDIGKRLHQAAARLKAIHPGAETVLLAVLQQVETSITAKRKASQ